jgi:acyl carrier protein
VVVGREEMPGDTRLVAYVVPSREAAPTSSELRTFLKAKLPEYMIPAAFVALGALPLTPSGKVDRRALPPPNQARPEPEGAFIAPRSALEALIAEVWRDVLRLDRVSVYDNFFDLGGHSLLAMQAIAKLDQKLGVRLKPKDLLFQTLCQLASVCEEQLSHGQRSEDLSLPRRVFTAMKALFRGPDDR